MDIIYTDKDIDVLLLTYCFMTGQMVVAYSDIV